jgi:choice-of-anchor B domain-containing protein
MRGDTAVLRPQLVDGSGQPVQGALAFIFTQGAFGQSLLTVDSAVSLVGGQPGMGQGLVLVRVANDAGSYQGFPGLKLVGRFEIPVSEWPAARIALHDLPYRPYAGTSFRLSGTVHTEHDTEHASAEIEWRSENPGVASISGTGVLTTSQPGQATIVATTVDGVSARLPIRVIANPVQQLDVSPKSARARTGDVVAFDVRPLDGRGRLVEGLAMAYSVFGLDSAGGQMFDDGSFVAEHAGAYRIVASVGDLAATALVEVAAREPASDVTLVGRGGVGHVATSDLWVFEGRNGRDYAYTGTHANGGGERMFVWDVTDPANVQIVDSVVVDARVVNDVKVNADASWAIITREGASSRRNGIVVLDLADPAQPRVIAELTDSLTAGIHNVWINGDVVYAVNDGTSAMHIIDMSDPANPRHAGRWELRPAETDKTLHDVWADGQYAYLSYWDDGLVILDVGAGTHGGTPATPAFVSRIAYEQGNTHVAWREGDYVFVGDEIGTADGMRGYIHVMDVSDIDQPREVAKYEVPEAGTHNVWVEDGLLYIAYYQGGLRIVDVSGDLRGDLYRQGREVGRFRTGGSEDDAIVPNSPMAWGPQPFKGNIFVSDMNSGLWVVKHERRPPTLVP